MEVLGYGCQDSGLLFSLNAQMWSVELPLVAFATPAQQRAYLPGMVSGDLIGANGMTEAGSGSDATCPSSRYNARKPSARSIDAHEDPGHWRSRVHRLSHVRPAAVAGA
jgi:hypothetical protein